MSNNNKWTSRLKNHGPTYLTAEDINGLAHAMHSKFMANRSNKDEDYAVVVSGRKETKRSLGETVYGFSNEVVVAGQPGPLETLAMALQDCEKFSAQLTKKYAVATISRLETLPAGVRLPKAKAAEATA